MNKIIKNIFIEIIYFYYYIFVIHIFITRKNCDNKKNYIFFYLKINLNIVKINRA